MGGGVGVSPMAEKSSRVFFVEREPMGVFVERETKNLLAEGWVHGDPTVTVLSRVWVPPWDKTLCLTLEEAVNTRSRRFMEAWVAAGQPEDETGFYKQWVARGG